MVEKIKLLEQQSKTLETTPNQRQIWGDAIKARGENFLNTLPERKAFHYNSNEKSKAILDWTIGTPKKMSSLLKALGETVEYTGINAASGKHFGYIPGGGLSTSSLADYYAAVINNYVGMFYSSPGAVRIENQLIRWMCDLMGYPTTALGNLTSGGSIANLIAITTARDVKGIEGDKIAQSVVYLSKQVHHCVQKALRIAGLGRIIIRHIDLDEAYRMKPMSLQNQIEADRQQGLNPFLVVASAGTTDTGAIDPLDKIADLAETYQLWYHIDAAYGGFFILVEALKSKFKGVERSDSLAIDPHKGLFIPYGTGAVLMKDVEAMYNSHFYKAGYMQDAQIDFDEFSPSDLSPELTKHFRSLRMWLPLQLHGVAAFASALEEKILLCQYFYKKVQTIGFEVGPYPDLSIMIFRYVPNNEDVNTFNERLVQLIQQDGQVFVSSTTIDGIYWIRLAVLSFRTHLKEVDLFFNILTALKSQLGMM